MGNIGIKLLVVAALILVGGGLYYMRHPLSNPLLPIAPSPSETPALVKTQESTGQLLPGLPPGFPLHPDAVVTSSYTGTAGVKPAYGAVWQVEDSTVFKVMEWYSEELAETWIFDSPQDEHNSKIQIVKAHKKDGPQVTLTAEQNQGTDDVAVTADFIL